MKEAEEEFVSFVFQIIFGFLSYSLIDYKPFSCVCVTGWERVGSERGREKEIERQCKREGERERRENTMTTAATNLENRTLGKYTEIRDDDTRALRVPKSVLNDGMMRFLFGFTVTRATRVCSDQRHGEKNMEKKKKTRRRLSSVAVTYSCFIRASGTLHYRRSCVTATTAAAWCVCVWAVCVPAPADYDIRYTYNTNNNNMIHVRGAYK